MWGTGGSVDGIHLLDSRSYNCCVGGAGSTVRNVKALSTMMTSDGLMIGPDSLAEHCYLYVGDNAIDWSGDRVTVRDITIGTTCKALFPQTNSSLTSLDSLFENIYVFRVGEEVISNNWNPKKLNMTTSFTVRGLDCTDCTYVPFLFTARNMGTNPKDITLENVVMPAPTGNTDPHVTNTAPEKRYHLRFYNAAGTDIETGGYNIKLKNLVVAGKQMTDSDLVILDRNLLGTVAYTNDGSFRPPVKNEKTVSWKAPGKVFVGALQVNFKNAPVTEGNDTLLPADELAVLLRVDSIASDTTKNGVGYVKASTLAAKGAVTKTETKDGSLVLTPKYNGENLFLPDSGEISAFTESTCYQVDLVVTEEDGELVYNLNNIAAANTGITRFFTDEAKMYGAGRYRLSFDVKSAKAATLQVIRLTETASDKKTIGTTNTWQSVSFNYEVAESDFDGMTTLAVLSGNPNSESFSLKNIRLIKVD